MRYQYTDSFEDLTPEQEVDLLCEINVKRQVTNTCHTTIVQNAWHRGQPLSVHGWIYGLENGLINDLNLSISNLDQLADSFVYHAPV